jgi:hypothetical protein
MMTTRVGPGLRFARLLALGVLGGLVLCGTRLAAQPDARERLFADAVSEARLKQAVRDLVAFGPRTGGTESGNHAADYLERFFAGIGLETSVLDDPPRPVHAERRWLVELDGSGARLESAMPFGFSPSIDPGVAGPLLTIDDLGAQDPAVIAGKVVYTTTGVSRRIYQRIASAPVHPLAVLTSAPNDPALNLDWAAMGSLQASASNPVPVFSVSYLDGRTLATAAKAGLAVRVSLDATIGEGRPRTVVATIRGEDPARYFLVTAHGDSDSGGPGADDNASGVATVMEMARTFSTLIASGQLPRPAVSLRFAIWGTEYHSSEAYVTREGAALKSCAGVINFDETGAGAEREAIYVESNEVPWNRTLLSTFEQIGADYRGQPGFWPEFATNPSQGGTDSYAFLPRKYKGTGTTALEIPATTVYTAAWDHTATLTQTPGWRTNTNDAATVVIDYSAYYHSAGDTPANTTEREPQNMVRAVRAAGLALLRLAWKP